MGFRGNTGDLPRFSFMFFRCKKIEPSHIITDTSSQGNNYYDVNETVSDDVSSKMMYRCLVLLVK